MQRQADAGPWTEKVAIAYNRGGATYPEAWPGSGHNPGAENNTFLFPRSARAAPVARAQSQVVLGLPANLLTGDG